MNKDYKKIINLFLRYAIILILGVGNLYIIYGALTPLTVNATNLAIKILTPTTLINNTIHFSQATIEIAAPCVAGSAFYLLLALLLSTSNVKPKTRIYSILTAVAILFTLNITRILILASMITSPNFEIIHWIFWHILSTIFVVATYVATIKLYKIESIPVYSDIKHIRSLVKSKHSQKKK